MPAAQALAVARAHQAGRAVRLTSYRHVALREGDLSASMVVWGLAGESYRFPAVGFGATGSASPDLLAVASQPLNRDELYAALTEIAAVFVPWFEAAYDASASARQAAAASGQTLTGWQAPQLVVPSAGTITALARMARLLAYLPTEPQSDGRPHVDPVLVRFGGHLRWLVEQAGRPGQQLLINAAGLLGELWASPQTESERSNLAALLAWVTPLAGTSGFDAAAAAELVPVGPLPSAAWERDLIEGLVDPYSEASRNGDDALAAAPAARIRSAYSELTATAWSVLTSAVGIARGVPLAVRYASERDQEDWKSYVWHMGFIRSGGRRRARPRPVQAMKLMGRLEAAAEVEEGRRLAVDERLRRDQVVAGKALDGVVVALDTDRVVVRPGNRRATRVPFLTLETVPLPMVPPPGMKLHWVGNPGKVAVTVEAATRRGGGTWRVELAVVSGVRAYRGVTAWMPLREVAQAGGRAAFIAPDLNVNAHWPKPDAVPFTHADLSAGSDTIDAEPDSDGEDVA